jgi:hypothetical protein
MAFSQKAAKRYLDLFPFSQDHLPNLVNYEFTNLMSGIYMRL